MGEDHPLAIQIAPLQTAINESKAALEALNVAIAAQKTADTYTNIAKANLTRQYEKNIYAAGSKFGKVFANRLFPPINKTTKRGTKEEKIKPTI